MTPNFPENTPHTKPIHVALNHIGRGLLFLLPDTPVPEGAAGQLKHVPLESLATAWILPFLQEYGLLSNSPRGHLAVTQEGGVFRVRAHLHLAPEVECVRCLKRERQEIEVDTTAFFADATRFQGAAASQRHRPEEEAQWDEDDDLYEFRGQSFQLDEFVLDTLQTAIPDFPLCSENCLGLCDQCGETLTSEHLCRRNGTR